VTTVAIIDAVCCELLFWVCSSVCCVVYRAKWCYDVLPSLWQCNQYMMNTRSSPGVNR